MAIMRGWRYAALIGGLVATIGIAIYPIIIVPILNPEKYKKIQAHTRSSIRQEDIQPGIDTNEYTGEKKVTWSSDNSFSRKLSDRQKLKSNSCSAIPKMGLTEIPEKLACFCLSKYQDMKIWTDPFDRKKS
ncbi:hypothetical protein NQ317_002035 [Molorchus minor]|uniref:Uncharacterized protein n=1 Tax=Molorchus minor TaxID=1323400 RepID=A0ABQ9JL55_9CUCU|nr:hypothetical protein NQ317_002035 [Molorchus minor]